MYHHHSEFELHLIAVPIFIHEVPIDKSWEILKVCGSGVAVVDVVGVLPDVNGQEGIVAIGQGISGIGGIENGDFLALLGEPGPSWAEIGKGLGWKLFDEVVDAAPFADNQVL